MFNLLPDNLKNSIKKDYNLRRLIVVLLFLIFIQISFMVFLFPIWLSSYYKEKEYITMRDEMNSNLSVLNIASTTSNIKTLNNNLAIMDKVLSYPKIVHYLNVVFLNKSKSILIDDISYVDTNEKSATLTVEGKSVTREALLTFVKNLQTSGAFSSVDLPISNYAKDKDLDFSIKLTIAES